MFTIVPGGVKERTGQRGEGEEKNIWATTELRDMDGIFLGDYSVQVAAPECLLEKSSLPPISAVSILLPF